MSSFSIIPNNSNNSVNLCSLFRKFHKFIFLLLFYHFSIFCTTWYSQTIITYHQIYFCVFFWFFSYHFMFSCIFNVFYTFYAFVVRASIDGWCIIACYSFIYLPKKWQYIYQIIYRSLNFVCFLYFLCFVIKNTPVYFNTPLSCLKCKSFCNY